ncbi:MAG: hypothetical protein R3E89_13950 [Thiolinea sp.]
MRDYYQWAMGKVNDSFEQVRIELKRPGEIRAALAACPVVYMPLGTYEYHQEHLLIGLDALTAQGICLYGGG